MTHGTSLQKLTQAWQFINFFVCFARWSILEIIRLVKMRHAAFSVVKEFAFIPISFQLYIISLSDCNYTVQTVTLTVVCCEIVTYRYMYVIQIAAENILRFLLQNACSWKQKQSSLVLTLASIICVNSLLSRQNTFLLYTISNTKYLHTICFIYCVC